MNRSCCARDNEVRKHHNFQIMVIDYVQHLIEIR